ncbi:PadR family transcriptional regulator [Streptomyces sp. S.PB5]|uniref:PadR family transcriptional regulator n=1 Tax=Streptomyces sp. S.PB5 TaxID=3020844 RepID=UPI0025B17564|nr:PadR family transcriptional regulator [Streptomyces sp. S.PB5]MDN3024990.1 PadR family transcriptional regulator [Streptomyces sp. S.PB5]
MADVRLTPSSYLVLGITDKLGEASAYDTKTEAARTVAPFWSVPHAQVHAQCGRLLEAGVLSPIRQESGRNRRVLALTRQGREALEEWLGDPRRWPRSSWTSTGAPCGRTSNSRRKSGSCSPPGSARRWSSGSATSG